MVYLGTYEFTDLNTGKITPKKWFTNAYAEEMYESEHVRSDTKLLHVILYEKYEKENLNKVMETQCQHLIEGQRNKFLKSLQKYE